MSKLCPTQGILSYYESVFSIKKVDSSFYGRIVREEQGYFIVVLGYDLLKTLSILHVKFRLM